MTRSMTALLASLLLLATGAATQAQPAKWVAGKHYTLIPPQRTTVPAGKVEVMEVFSYGCPACNQFRPNMKLLQSGLPKNAQITYLHASWNAAENWPLFQRAFLTASAMGVIDKGHDAMYDAIWTTGELGIVDNRTKRLKTQLPTIEDVAKFYERVAGVKAANFVSASKTPGVDLKIRQTEAQIKAMAITGTPTLVVAGKYRINNEHFETMDDIIALVNFLVVKESAAAPKPAATTAAPAATPKKS